MPVGRGRLKRYFADLFMNKLVESSDRGPIDYFHFGACFAGFILTATGVILTSPGLTLFGALVLGFGLAYFLVEN